MQVVDVIAHCLKEEGNRDSFRLSGKLSHRIGRKTGHPHNNRAAGAESACTWADAISRLSSGDKIGVFCMQSGPGAENAFGGGGTSIRRFLPDHRAARRISSGDQPSAAQLQLRPELCFGHQIERAVDDAGDDGGCDAAGRSRRCEAGGRGRRWWRFLPMFPQPRLRSSSTHLCGGCATGRTRRMWSGRRICWRRRNGRCSMPARVSTMPRRGAR